MLALNNTAVINFVVRLHYHDPPIADSEALSTYPLPETLQYFQLIHKNYECNNTLSYSELQDVEWANGWLGPITIKGHYSISLIAYGPRNGFH